MRSPELLRLLQSRGHGWAVCAGLIGAVLLVLMARGLLGHAPHYDELLHVLAARGLLESGEPLIDQGTYPRAELFSWSVAWSYRVFGESLVAARVPALIAAAALVFVMGVWVTHRAGFLAGLTASVLLCVIPATVDLAVFARFYTLHALVLALIFIGLFEAWGPGRTPRHRYALLAVAIALLPLAWHLQESTVIAAGAGLAGVLALLMLDHWPQVKSTFTRHPARTLSAVVLVIVAAIGLIALSGLADRLDDAPLWAAGKADRPHFYLVALGDDTPFLWPLLPLAIGIAVSGPAQRRLGLYCTVIVVSALAVHSIAAQKALRYIYYVLPLVGVLWGCAIATVATNGGARGRLGSLALFVLLATGLAISQEGVRTLNLVAGRLAAIERLPFGEEPDWTPIVAELEKAARTTDRVVTSNSMKALYYLGRYDFELNATIVPETNTAQDFGIDERTGRKAIGSPEAIGRVLDQPGTSLVVIEVQKIGRTSGVTADSQAIVESRCREMSLAVDVGVRAWTCT